MDVEDFSFPATTDSPPCFIDSPPLWRASSAPSSFSRHHDDKVAEGKPEDWEKGLSHSFHQELIEAGDGPGKGGSLSISEDRMDMLWEDFNEELLSPLALHRNGSNSEKVKAGFGSVKAWSISKANTDKPGVVVLLKVLRRLFLIHSNHRPLKKGQAHSWRWRMYPFVGVRVHKSVFTPKPCNLTGKKKRITSDQLV